MRPIDMVLERLQKPRKGLKGYMAICPAHKDKSPSLSVSEGKEGRVLLHCHAGCEFRDILAAIGLNEVDAFADTPSKRTGPSRSALLNEVFIVRIFEANPNDDDRPRYEQALKRLGAYNESVR